MVAKIGIYALKIIQIHLKYITKEFRFIEVFFQTLPLQSIIQTVHKQGKEGLDMSNSTEKKLPHL